MDEVIREQSLVLRNTIGRNGPRMGTTRPEQTGDAALSSRFKVSWLHFLCIAPMPPGWFFGLEEL